MEQPPVDTNKFSIVRQHRRMLANLNFYWNQSSRILDFGCGDGHLVYEYRDAGFDTYGFEICPAPIFRQPEDEKYFRFALTGKPVNVPEFEIHETSYKIPCEDEFFDFVFSTETLEHVLDHNLVFAETARVLRKGGAAIHTFPARYRLIEPHMFVPLGGIIRNYFWFLLWAYLGVRNQFQQDLGPIECARRNLAYARKGVNYLPIRKMLRLARNYFSEAELVPHLWKLGNNGSGGFKAAFLLMPHINRYVRWYYSRFDEVVLFLRK